MDMSKPTKKTPGRKKIEMKKVDKNANKLVTFSKRRGGLFRKASELCILCNVFASIIVFSPADKLFCFGQPNTETIITRYLRGTKTLEATKAKSKSSVVSCEEHNREYDEAKKRLELEKKELATFAKDWKRVKNWWNEPIDNMSVEQMEKFMVAIYELRGKLAERAVQLTIMPPIL